MSVFLKKHKNKIVIVALMVAVLTGLWFMSGTEERGAGNSAPPYSVAENTNSTESAADILESIPDMTDDSAETSENPASELSGTTITSITESPTNDTTVANPGTDVSTTETITETSTDPSTDPVIITTETPTTPPVMTTEPPTVTTTSSPTEINATSEKPTETTQSKYNTDPVPDGKPLPVEPQDATVGDGSFTVTLSVRCDTLINNTKLDKEKRELVPDDGVIFAATTIMVYEGESVFNVLQREMKRAKIHMAFRNTPIYNSAYIEAINNLYEFDGGDLSGWMYKVNDWFPNYGCSRYQLQPGDVIEWVYTCDLGRDVGGYYAAGG